MRASLGRTIDAPTEQTRVGPAPADAAAAFSPAVRVLARCGYGSMGAVYVVIGVLAVLAARDRGLQPADFGGAVEALRRSWAGKALGAVIVAGLACHALWLFVRAVSDPERRGPCGWAWRAASFCSGVIYVGMAYFAMRLLEHRQSPDPAGNAPARHWAAVAMAGPAGRWGVAAAGIILGGYGAYELYRAWRADFDGRLDMHRLPVVLGRCAVHGSRLGMVARAAALVVVAGFLVAAAYRRDPGSARGLGGALASLRARPAGPWVLGLVAWGLVSYGLHNFVLACFRRFGPPAGPSPSRG